MSKINICITVKPEDRIFLKKIGVLPTQAFNKGVSWYRDDWEYRQNLASVEVDLVRLKADLILAIKRAGLRFYSKTYEKSKKFTRAYFALSDDEKTKENIIAVFLRYYNKIVPLKGDLVLKDA